MNEFHDNEFYKTDQEFSKIKSEKLKKSYVERALYNYLDNHMLGGYRVLISSKYIAFFVYVVIETILSIALAVLNILGISSIEFYLYKILIIGLFSGLALILGGLIGGLLNNDLFTDLITGVLIIASIGVNLLFDPNYNNLILQYVKISFFILYVLIGTITIFSILLSFHQSLSYRFINLGNSPNRMLFQGLLRSCIWLTFPMYINLFFQKTIDAQILAIFGSLVSIIILINFYNLPKTNKEDPFVIKGKKAGKINFNQILGFYSIFLIFHISQSYNSGGRISNIIIDFILLIINSFYLINNYSRKIDNIADLDEIQKRLFIFERKNSTLMKIKKRFGQKGLIFIAMGIALGYNMVMLDSFLGSPIVLLQNIGGDLAPLNVIYHRMWLYFALFLILIVMIVYQFSPSFDKKTINRYSARHVLKMFADLFRVSDEGNVGFVLGKIERESERIYNTGKKIKENLAKSWKQFFSLDGNDKGDGNDESGGNDKDDGSDYQ